MTTGVIYVLYACFLAGAGVISALYARLLFGERDVLSVCSVALGEVGVKERIKRVVTYKKPMLWVVIACLILCVVVAVLFLTDPKGEETPSDILSETPSNETSDESESVRYPRVYIRDFYAVPNRYGMCVPIELKGSTSSRRESEHQGEQIPFPVYGEEGELLTYSVTYMYPYKKHPVLGYQSDDGEQTFLVDGETGDVLYFRFLEYPAGYEVKTQKTNTYLAKRYCRKLLELLYPEISLDDYELAEEQNFSSEIHLYYKKYMDGIQVDGLRFYLDAYGNIHTFDRDACSNEGLPSYTDDEYIAMARARLDDFYADKIGIAELTDFEIQDKQGIYLRDRECFAIEYDIWLTAVYEDGAEERIGYTFILPYGSDGKAIEVEVEQDENAIKMHGNFAYRISDGSVVIEAYFGSDAHVVIPDRIEDRPVTRINDWVFSYESEIVSVDLPKTLIEIGANAFKECTSLQTVSVKEGLQIIEEEAFDNCTALAEFTFPTTLLEIGATAFYGTALREIVLPESLVKIGAAAFRQCLELEFVMLGEGLSQIGDVAFAETPITEIVIPGTVSRINESAFYDCKELQKVTFEGNEIAEYRYPDSDSWERNYTIYFYEGKGFSAPYWNGYKTVMIADESKCDIVRNYEPSNLAELTFVKLPKDKTPGNATEDTAVLYAADGKNTVLYLPDEEEYILLYDSSTRFAESCAMQSRGNLLLYEPFDDGTGKCDRIRVISSYSGSERASVHWIRLPRAVELTELFYSSDVALDYLFVFDTQGLAYLYYDRGDNEGYRAVSLASKPTCESGETPVFVNMFGINDEGWLYFAPNSDARPIGERLFLTVDGGNTWFHPQGDAQTEALLGKLIDAESLKYQNITYILTVKETENEPSLSGTHRFTSQDLVSWTYQAVSPSAAVVYDDCVNTPLLYLPHIQSSDVPREFVTAMQNDPLTMDFDAETDKSAVLESKYIPLWNAELEHTAAAIFAKVGEEDDVHFASYRDAFLESELQAIELEKSYLGITGEQLAYRTFDAYRQLTYRFKWILYLIETAEGGTANDSVRFLYRNTHTGTPKNLLLATASDRFVVWDLYKTQDGTDSLSAYARAMIYNPLDADPNTDTSDRRRAVQDAIETLIAVAGNDDRLPIYAWEGAQNSMLKWEHNSFAVLHTLGYLDVEEASLDDSENRRMREMLFMVKYWTYLYETEILDSDAEQSLQF